MTPQDIAKAITDLHLGPAETLAVARLMGVVCREEAMAFSEYKDMNFIPFKSGYLLKRIRPSQQKGPITISEIYREFNEINSKAE